GIGRRELALRQYSRFREVLHRELDVQPAEETTTLYRQISAGRLPSTTSIPSAQGAFVGREIEMEALRRALKDADARRGRLIALVGEGGIGKSRLASELATCALLDGAEVFWGRCYEGDGAPAYWPWIQIMRSYLESHEFEQALKDMGEGAAEISQIVPEIRERLPELAGPVVLEGEQARFRFFDRMS